jgi:tRNA(fMet)-specific endonuclease VapC
MMQEIVIDTDVLINCLRGNIDALNLLKELAQTNVLNCSAITVAEIYAGMKERERQKTELLLNSLSIISVDKKIAEHAGIYRRETKSHSLELDDCLIAATCLVKKAVLVTKNIKHYPMNDIKKIAMK